MQHWLAWNWTYPTRCTVSSDTRVFYTCQTPKTRGQLKLKTLICSKRAATTSSIIPGSENTCCPLWIWCVAVLLAGLLQDLYRPGSVYSITPQWWHLMVLQYVAASFHQKSVSAANINTVQYPNHTRNMKYQLSQLLWYPRCCFLILHHGSLCS
jgi:hypothetical protein